jgi:outer membrane protein assembly factor BamB
VPYGGEAVADEGDTIYLYTDRLGGFPSMTQVAALEAATGALRWQSTWQGRAALTPLRLVDGILSFVAIGDETSSQTGRRSLYLDALAASDGRQAQDIYLGEFNNVTPQFVVAGGVAVIQVDQRELQARRVSDGRQLWSTALDQTLNELIAADDTLFVTSFPDELTALDASSGAIRWRKAFGNQVESHALSPDTRAGHGTLYVVTTGASAANGAAGGAPPYVVYTLDPATAAVRWTFAATDHSFGASLLAGPDAVNVHSRTSFYALRALDGALLWQRGMPDVGDHHWILSTFSHVEGSVLFVGAIEIVPNRTLKLIQPLHGQLYLYAVDQTRGSVYWGAALGPVARITSSYLP